MTTTTISDLEKFQKLLRELFQDDSSADLDFGIYRIMNHRRDAIERFISENLPKSVSDTLSEGNLADQERANARLEAARVALMTEIPEDPLDADGNLAERFRGFRDDIRVIGEYLDAQQAAAGSRSRVVHEADVYNHLYTFFSRYYQDGDFISKRRYSRSQRYAIPYNGEEVYLHWANADQYYVKTAEHFRNYDWNTPNGVSVRFRVRDADVEQNNVKGPNRFFLPDAAAAEWDAEARVLTVPFDYRPMTTDEQGRYGKSGNSRQDNINTAAANDIPDADGLADAPDARAAITAEYRRNGKDDPVSRLKHHLHRYTRRNDSDFFIHKDLRGFLSRELDFYLKNEVLNLDDLSAAGPDMAQGWFQEMGIIKAVGADIIDFLAQAEDFQKLLWEKRKFVTETHYCIALEYILENFYPRIIANDAQWDEWQYLYGIDAADRSNAVLNANPTLLIDTAHFDSEFSDALLATFGDIDEATDGLLIDGDNWQAINLLSQQYRNAIQTTYIDPPYNTDASAIIYKNGYKDSSWLSLMENRLNASRSLMEDDGIIGVAIDDVEYPYLQTLMSSIYGDSSNLGTAMVRSNPAGRSTPTGFSSSHEYALFYGNKSESRVGEIQRTERQVARYKFEDDIGKYEWVNFRKHGGLNAYRDARPRLFYPLYAGVEGRVRIPSMVWDDLVREWIVEGSPNLTETVVWPIDDDGREKTWKWGVETLRNQISEVTARLNRKGETNVYIKSRMKSEGTLPTTWWDKREYSAAEHGTKTLSDLFGDARGFSFPKSPRLVEDCIRASGCEDDSTVLDYFAGSGTTAHAVINLNREDGGRRKFILVEMGEYFDTVLLPRVKKVTFSPEWKNGSPVRPATPEEAERSPRIVKYMRLESYEDALDGIAFDEATVQLGLEDRFGDEYLLKYMLSWETKDSRTLLNARDLTAPFSYILRARSNGADRNLKADVPETFNYLIGLNVRKREVHYDEQQNRYLVFRGETRDAPGRNVAVIWRDASKWKQEEFARDRAFVKDEGLADGADTLYVNGGSCIPNATAVEPLFKSRMFAPVSAAN